MKPLVVVWSGDAEFHLLANHILMADGFQTLVADGLEEALHLAREREPFALVMDCRADNSPAAVEICGRLKTDPDTAGTVAVAVISQGAEEHHLELLKAGVDESCLRPVAPSRLLEFLRARLQRAPSKGRGLPHGTVLRYEGIEMNLASVRVRRNGREIRLAPIEFKLLRLLLERAEQVVSRDELIAAAWPSTHYVEGRTVDVHVGRLRRFLMGRDDTDVVRTVRGIGYALDVKGNGG
ncbi:two-component system, OmpR family, phosphate regulon response regulator PhoB [Xaviernesmea oryzae]|uniref:Two-component system, OmpR family, phosphate regulon response regulator PhoB n=1 Tax=Xaviernesmea oryzae TaxID=464029 RepID=A0A1X7FV35_9HYPH|nr:response regulator transcription factor [Xaviernesmea oryzae]SMF59271.1 two-component system, OmpR family, phosphate regulon response regulator PhoB [Xaviernesmea oryzae]